MRSAYFLPAALLSAPSVSGSGSIQFYDDARFSWTIDKDVMTGTFEYSWDGWVAFNPKSPSAMEALIIICWVVSGNADCSDRTVKEGYAFPYTPDPNSSTKVTKHSSNATTNTIVFTRPVTEELFALDTAERTLWAVGKMDVYQGIADPLQHSVPAPVQHLMSFSGAAVNIPNFISPDTGVYISIGLLLFASVVNVGVTCLKIRVHHKLRHAWSIVFPFFFAAAFACYMYASYISFRYEAAAAPANAIAMSFGRGSLLLQGGLLLAAGRRFIFQDPLGVSHERATAYHAVMGVLCLVMTAVHLILIQRQFEWDFLTSSDWREGSVWPLAGLIAFCAMVVGALPAMLRTLVSYRAFRVLHFAWMLVILFTFLHLIKKQIPYFLLPGLINVVGSFVYGLIVNCTARIVYVVHDEEAQVTVLKLVRRTFMSYSSAAGQWCYLLLPSVSKWELHPFSIARSEVVVDPQTGRKEQHMLFIVKASNGPNSWTRRLLATEVSDGPIFGIGGPFGKLTLPLEAYSNIVLISGGIGVTPNLSILQQLALSRKRGKFPRLRRVLWVWVNRGVALERNLMGPIAEDAKILMDSGVAVSMQHYITNSSKNSLYNSTNREMTLQLVTTSYDTSHVSAFKTRPVFDELFEEFISTFEAGDSSKIALYQCGPPPMLKACSSAVDEFNARHTDYAVHLHSETFGI